jgi:hypothetical protein
MHILRSCPPLYLTLELYLEVPHASGPPGSAAAEGAAAAAEPGTTPARQRAEEAAVVREALCADPINL